MNVYVGKAAHNTGTLPFYDMPFYMDRIVYRNTYWDIHETGHWLGLFHTFQNGCEAINDMVSDTPAAIDRDIRKEYKRWWKFWNYGKDFYVDTCPEMAGLDNLRNVMSYDKLKGFTEGQKLRVAIYWYYRTHNRQLPDLGKCPYYVKDPNKLQ